MNKSFPSFDVSFDTNDQSYFADEEAANLRLTRDQVQILDWLEKFGISFPFELIPVKFSNGVHLCEIINKSLKKDLKFYKNPSCLVEKKFNVRKALGMLRTLKDFKSSFVWNEEQVSAAKSSAVWGILHDLKTYIQAKSQVVSKSSAVIRSKSGLRRENSFIFEENTEQLLKDLVFKVRPWLKYLELDGLINSVSNYVKDNLRNGVILCRVLKLIDPSTEFCEAPRVPEDVYRNLDIAVNAIMAKVHIKKLDLVYYTEPIEVWSLLHTLMMFYPNLSPPKKNYTWPYDQEANLQLQESILAWVQRLLALDDLNDFEAIVGQMRTGELLAKIVNKVTGKEVIGISAKPKTPKVAFANIEKSFKVLANDRKFSQEYVRNPDKILNGDTKFIMLLLEDLHRYHAGLGIRKRGKSYHDDGPFIVQTNRPVMTPQRSYSNLAYLTFDKSLGKRENVEQNNGNLDTSFSRKLVKNSKSAFEYIEQNTFCSKNFLTDNLNTSGFFNNASQNSRKITESSKLQNVPSFQKITKIENFVDFSLFSADFKKNQPNSFNLSEFTWLDKLGLALPENLDLRQDKIPSLSDGVLLCSLISKVEFKDIQGVQRCRFGTPIARRNIKLAMGVLKLKPNLASKALYLEDQLASGDGEAFRIVLAEIYKIYKNAISTLIRFNRKNRNSSFV